MVELILDYTGEHLSAEMEEIIKKAASQTLIDENINFDAEISVTITNDEDIREINKQYRNIDKETDVLSFPLFEFENPAVFNEADLKLEQGAVVLGDIIISMDKIYSQAEEYGHSPNRELAYLTVHSMLHLLGYDHMKDEDKKIMREKEERTLANIDQIR